MVKIDEGIKLDKMPENCHRCVFMAEHEYKGEYCPFMKVIPEMRKEVDVHYTDIDYDDDFEDSYTTIWLPNKHRLSTCPLKEVNE